MHTKTLANLSRAELAQLGREYMLVGQFNSRTGYAALAMNHGQEAYKATAIDNWMAASPVYSKRMQRAMKLKTGSDVAAILKGMQLECGLSHQYFDARFELASENEGFFWLQRCGPLLETEPRGDAAVKVMCHDIEDPTFDATAAAGNPQARVRPIHRPPRSSVSDGPVCRWRVYIDHDAEPLQEPEVAKPVYETKLAQLHIARTKSKEQGGLDYYDGPVIEELALEYFSHQALLVLCKEFGVQIHLLIHGLAQAVAQRYGDDAVADLVEFQMIGTCWVASERIANCFGHDQGGIDSILAVLSIHPAFQPDEYYRISVERVSSSTARLSLCDCLAMNDDAVFSWFDLLRAGRTAGLAALVQGVDRRAQIHAVPGDSMSFDIVVDEEAEGVQPPVAAQVAMGTQLYKTKLVNPIELLDIT